MPTLKDILPQNLITELTPAEEAILDKAMKGEAADFTTGDKETDDPNSADNWGVDRTIRPEFMYWLCTDEGASKLVHARGIRITGAKVPGELDFDSASIKRPLVLFGCAVGEIILRDAETRFVGFIGCTTGPITADRISTNGSFFLRYTKTTGEVRLTGADIGGDLDCIGAELENCGKYAFKADRVKVSGSVFLRVKKATGEVRLIGADIGGDLDCIGAELENCGKNAFSADGVTVKGNVFLNVKKAAGEVSSIGADIGGDLDCIGAEFENSGKNAFTADRVKVSGSVFLKVKKATGEVRLLGADIGDDLDCTDAEFVNPGGSALTCENTLIKNRLFLTNMKPIQGRLDLLNVQAGALVDDESGWPDEGKLEIDGFQYGGLPGDETPKTAEKRLEWIRLQPEKPFKPRPYEQLAKVFRDMGCESDAKDVLIAKQEDLLRLGELDHWQRFCNRFLGITLRHGYSPWRVLGFAVAVVLLGWLLFGFAYDKNIMRPTIDDVYTNAEYDGAEPALFGGPQPTALCKNLEDYPRFNPLVYSLDVFLPVVDLHQENRWLPVRDTPDGWKFRLWLWLHIIFGWASTTLLVVYMTGLVRND